jgi:uncharacterized membrane protein YhhN
MKQQILRISFIILAVTELFAEFSGNIKLEFFTKPLLMPLLIVYVLFSINRNLNSIYKWLIIALAMSWVGDVTLMLTPISPEDVQMMGVPKNKYYFFAGLIGFFIAHVFYIKIYLQNIKKGNYSLFEKSKWLFAPILIYTLVLLYIVVPAVFSNPEKSIATIPVIFYAGILSSMVGFALNRYQNTNQKSFVLVLVGSILFLFSDSLIAINFLVTENGVPNGRQIIMLTYISAQFLIVEGLLAQTKKNEKV